MALAAVFGGFVFIDVVCVNELVQSTSRSTWYLCLGLDSIPWHSDDIILLLYQLAGVRGFGPRNLSCDQLFFPHRRKRTMTIDDASTRPRLDIHNFRPN